MGVELEVEVDVDVEGVAQKCDLYAFVYKI